MAGAPSGWGSNAWGDQFWEDNGIVLDYGAWGSLVQGFGDGVWGNGVQLTALSTSTGSAIASISMSTPFGKSRTSTQDLAGLELLKYSEYISFISLNCFKFFI